MFGFLKTFFIAAVTFLIPNVLSLNFLECVSTNNQECKARPKTIDTNANESVFYPYSIKVNKCSGNCNDVNDPYAKLCIHADKLVEECTSVINENKIYN